MIVGRHLIDGQWVSGATSFTSHAMPHRTYAQGGEEEVDLAATAAEEAFPAFATTRRQDRALFLERIAGEIEAMQALIVETAMAETGLPKGRLDGELARTTGQLRLFADRIRGTTYLDLRHDRAQPERQPLPRPDMRMIAQPIGPIAVFGASNFPLAFSVAGGDTASALAAGCPVIVKAHPAHPGTSELVALAIDRARQASALPAGIFALIQGTSHDLGAALANHPLIAGIGFTGSLRAGRALFDLCAARPVPIPFFGELGSVNPV